MNHHIDVGHSLKLLGAERRRMGAEALRGSDVRLNHVAAILVEKMYDDGDFGEAERPPQFLIEKAIYLGAIFQGAYEDVCVEWEREK